MLRNVLIFHSGALGDLVLSFPIALALTRLYPTSRVRYVVSGQKGQLASRMVGVEWVDVETAMSPGGVSSPSAMGAAVAGGSGFSALFSPDAEPGESVRKLLATTHRVVSFVAQPGDVWSRRVRELAPSASLTCLRLPPHTHRPSQTPASHALDLLLDQCGQADCGGDPAMASAVLQILSLLKKQGLIRRVGVQGGGRGVVIHPGAGSPAKCWPVDCFRELVLRLRDRSSEEVRWVLGEVELERMPSDHRRALEALGDVVVPSNLLGLLEEALGGRVFVGNDSGPGHVAAIAGVPTVSLFGPTDPAIWAPFGPRVGVVRSPSDRMDDISVDQVVLAVNQV